MLFLETADDEVPQIVQFGEVVQAAGIAELEMVDLKVCGFCLVALEPVCCECGVFERPGS
jgi:hypothetical protein